MEILNRSLQAIRGISDAPILQYQQEDLELSNEDEENENQNRVQQPQSSAMDHVADDIIIDLGEEEQNQLPLSPQNSDQVENAQDTDESTEVIEEGYRKAIENIIQIALYSVLKWTTVAGLVLLILIVTIKWHLPYIYVFSLISLVDLFSLVDLLRMWRKISDIEAKRYRIKVVQNILSAASKISLIAYVYVRPFQLTYSFAPALGFDFLNTLILSIKNRNSSLSRFYNVKLLLKTFYSALVISITLKLDGFINWHWREVFMSYWALFGITVGFAVVITLVFLNKFLSFFLVDRNNFESYGILWLGLLFAGNSISSCIIVIRLQKILENQLNANSLLLLFILTSLYNIALTVFTTIHFKKLETFFKKLTVTEQELQTLPSPRAQDSENQKPPSPKKLVIPRFLTKSSNTYFRKVTQKDIEKSKRQKLKPKGTKLKVKQPRQRQNSFDQSTKNTWVRNAALLSNPDLLTIPETDRDKLRTEMLSTNRASRRDIKTLNLNLKKISDTNVGFTSQPSDRSRAGLIGSYRSTVNYATGEYTNADDTNGTQVSARRRDGEKLDSFRTMQEGPLFGYLTPENQDKIVEEESEQKHEDGFSVFLEDIGQLSARKANSLSAIPDPKPALPLITESPSNKENSRVENSKLEASEMMTSPTLDASMAQQCLICFDKPPDAVFMECGHGGVCYECSLEIWKTTTECYLCRKKINQVLQIDSKHKIGKHIIKVISATQMVLCDNQNQNQNLNQNANLQV